MGMVASGMGLFLFGVGSFCPVRGLGGVWGFLNFILKAPGGGVKGFCIKNQGVPFEAWGVTLRSSMPCAKVYGSLVAGKGWVWVEVCVFIDMRRGFLVWVC